MGRLGGAETAGLGGDTVQALAFGLQPNKPLEERFPSLACPASLIAKEAALNLVV
jgi:hypothetical protein